jgi:Ca-activated chloride channel homolog
MTFDYDPYNLLGIPPTASADEIKNAYRRIVKRLHPDSNPHNIGAGKQFQDITVAYDILIDPIRRRDYDAYAKQRAEDNSRYFTLRVTPSKRRIPLLNEAQVIYLLAEIFPDPRAEDLGQRHTASLNLTLVLDRSNSMNGARLEKVKIAANQIVDHMTSNDILSVVTFNDRAEVVIPATRVTDKPALKARISMMLASGGTEIYNGLAAGVQQNRQFFGPKLVNHIILLTDGRTYGDEHQSLELADIVAKEGIGISAMGLGSDWNDDFLDKIASKTGGASSYISTANGVIKFFNDHVKHLSNAFAERVRLSVAPDPDVELEEAFKLLPHSQPLELRDGELQLGNLQANRPISVLLQLQMPASMPEGFRSIARLVATGDILANRNQRFQAVSDISLEVTQGNIPVETPKSIMDALSKLSLYRLQERANDALERGDIVEATRRLENLATRLLEMGHEELSNQARSEARRVAHTSGLSDKGRKTLKYETRFLLAGPQEPEN